MVYPGSAVSWNRQDCNKTCNECKCSDTNVVFQKAIFLILVVRNDKRSSATALPEIVYMTVILRFLYASNCSLNRLNLSLLFLR